MAPKNYGIAIDLGTSTLVGGLVDLKTKDLVSKFSIFNPQNIYGQDIITRFKFALSNKDGLHKLKSLAREGINKIVLHLLRAKEKRGKIKEVVISGNTGMEHLFLGIPVDELATFPFKTKISGAYQTTTEKVGIKFLGVNTPVYILPPIAGFVGGDTVSLILCSSLHKRNKISLAVDIGTNGEIVLGNKDKILATSCAAGPAFEGANLSCGMPALPGAIERIKILQDVNYKTIGNKKARGICGSGIIDLTAELVRLKIINNKGKIERIKKISQELSSRIMETEEGKNFLVAETDRGKIILSQKDVRNIQLAKAAILSGIKVLMKELKIKEKDIKSVYLSGAFGSYLNMEAIQRIKLLPDLPLDIIKFAGNTSLEGAKRLLILPSKKLEVDVIRKKVKIIQLGGSQDFQRIYLSSLNF